MDKVSKKYEVFEVDTCLTIGAVEFKSFAICGIDGTNVPDTKSMKNVNSA